MQRVRVGLTGLACVFLMVFLAAAFFGLANTDTAVPDAGNPGVPSVDANMTAEPREPLAELGVTPGNGPGGTGPAASPSAAGSPAPAAAVAPGGSAAPLTGR
jgi:hypothetical protein